MEGGVDWGDLALTLTGVGDLGEGRGLGTGEEREDAQEVGEEKLDRVSLCSSWS